MITTISVEGIECYSYHGCLPEETKIGGRFQVDVIIQADMSKAVLSDDLSETIDYVIVNKVVNEQMLIPSKLIEHVAGRILKALTNEFTEVSTIDLKITKFNPPVNGNVYKTVFSIAKTFK